jgi:hypothetical protein
MELFGVFYPRVTGWLQHILEITLRMISLQQKRGMAARGKAREMWQKKEGGALLIIPSGLISLHNLALLTR